MNRAGEILDRYLEGAGSRADLESMLLRIDLPAEVKREIGAFLALCDDLASSLSPVAAAAPSPGAVERLREALRTDAAGPVLPAWVEATIAGDEGPAALEINPGEAEEREEEALMADRMTLEILARTMSPPPIPQGAVDRLTGRLREEMQRSPVSVDTAKRLMGRAAARSAVRWSNWADVAAAGKDDESDAPATPPSPPAPPLDEGQPPEE